MKPPLAYQSSIEIYNAIFVLLFAAFNFTKKLNSDFQQPSEISDSVLIGIAAFDLNIALSLARSFMFKNMNVEVFSCPP